MQCEQILYEELYCRDIAGAGRWNGNDVSEGRI
jgi:hypothetical protein